MKQRMIFLLMCCVLFPISVVQGKYLKPTEAGFHHCALIYYNKDYTCETIKPLLVKYEKGQPTQQAGYDAVLFLLYTVNGKQTLTGETVMADWLKHLEIYFHGEINVPALSKASSELRSGGFLNKRIKVIFSIPWPNRKVHQFGDVDGDGVSEDLQTNEGLKKVLSWYITRVAEEMKKYPELDLWGFYMMNEGIREDNYELARCFCKTIHDHGFRSLWIPYYHAPGAKMAYELGFDVSIMQSNWTFNTNQNGQGARRNQLYNTAYWTKANRQGVELEINPPEESRWQDIFAKSLETGTQTGFQQAASATYFGSDFYWPRSDRPATRHLYSLWMDYLAGKPIVLPQPGQWTQSTKEDGSTEIRYRFKQPTNIRLLDLFYHDIPGDHFVALLTAEGREPHSQAWTPLGWKVCHITKNELRPMENMNISFGPKQVSELRILVQPLNGSLPGKLVQVEPDSSMEIQHVTQSFKKPYSTNKERPIPTYPDESGRDLLDGIVHGSWKNYVGWSQNCPAEVFLDFGEMIEYDEIRLHLLESKSASIVWPESIEAMSSHQTGIPDHMGYGPMPSGYSYEYLFQGEPSSKVSTLHLAKSQKARTMTIRFTRSGWLFLSEMEFFLHGKKLPTDRIRYTLSQLDRQSPTPKSQYSDNGIMLTDGFVSSDFNEGNVGVSGGSPLIVSVDLQTISPIHKVTCMLLDGHTAGVRMPKNGTIRFSNDRTTWSEPIPFKMPASQKLKQIQAIPVSVSLDKKARYIKVEFSSEGWTFLSEILVE